MVTVRLIITVEQCRYYLNIFNSIRLPTYLLLHTRNRVLLRECSIIIGWYLFITIRSLYKRTCIHPQNIYRAMFNTCYTRY